MRVQTGCGCLTPQTASRILASLSIVSSIITAIAVGVVMSDLDNQVRTSERMNVDLDVRLKPLCFAVIIAVLINVCFAGLMIFGSVRRRPGYMFPWIALGFTGVVYCVIAFVALVIIGGIVLPIGVFFRMLALSAPFAVLHVYLWLILYTHYKEILSEKYGNQTNPKEGKIFIEPMNPYHNF